MIKGIVRKAYRSAYPDPLVLVKGEKINVEERETDWEGWYWATDKNGKQGWVPKKFVKRDGDTGVLTRDYNAAELTADEGISIEIIEQESGWALVRTDSGETGWLPLENIALE